MEFIGLKRRLYETDWLPKIIFLRKGEFPIRIYLDEEKGKYILETEKTNEKCLGYQCFQFLLIAPQPFYTRILTIFHEFCHFLNYKTLDKEWLDNLIDKVL